AAESSRMRRQAGKPLPAPKRALKIAWPWSLRTMCGVEILELAPFHDFPWLVHGFSTRRGGNSVTDSGERVLNLGFREWDSRQAVKKNRGQFQSAIGADPLTLVPLKQFHSAMIRGFETSSAEPSKGDASLTSTPGLLLGVQTADCVPILLVDP